MLKEKLETLFPFICDECGKNVEEDNGSPLDYLCFICIEEGTEK